MADERQVIVLNLRGNASLQPWPEGTRAVIAELAASDDQVLLRPSTSSTFAALMDELEKAATEEQTVGAVAVGKSGSAGIAYVWVNGGGTAIRVEDDLRDGAVAEGAVALRVTEILHVTNLELPSARREEKSTPKPPPPVRRPLPPPEPERGPPVFTTWLGVGLITSSDASAPVPMASFGARVPLVSFLGIEAAAASSFGWLEVPTTAGRAEVSMQALTLHAVVDPWADRVASVSLGLGGGAVWTSVLGTPLPGYTDLYDSTTVGLLSARLGFALRGENLSFIGHAEAGLLTPAVTLAADGRTLAELGRPWFSALLGVGFSP